MNVDINPLANGPISVNSADDIWVEGNNHTVEPTTAGGFLDLQLGNGAELTLTQLEVRNWLPQNPGTAEGPLYVQCLGSGRVSILRTTFADNRGGLLPGAIMSNCDIDVALSRFLRNETNSGYGGGVIRVVGSNLNVSNSTFLDNMATDTSSSRGGAIVAEYSASAFGRVVIDASTFAGNEASTSGGAIYMDSLWGELLVYNSTFRSNIGVDLGADGGAIYTTSIDNVEVNTSTFRANRAGSGSSGEGGAIFSASSSVTLTQNLFDVNYGLSGTEHCGNAGTIPTSSRNVLETNGCPRVQAAPDVVGPVTFSSGGGLAIL